MTGEPEMMFTLRELEALDQLDAKKVASVVGAIQNRLRDGGFLDGSRVTELGRARLEIYRKRPFCPRCGRASSPA